MDSRCVTSRSLPQQIGQIRSPNAGQKRFGGRFWQMGQGIQFLSRFECLPGYGNPAYPINGWPMGKQRRRKEQ